MGDPSSSTIGNSKDPGTLAFAQWEAARQVWLRKRDAASISHPPACEEGLRPDASSSVATRDESGSERGEKFKIAVERMLFLYDQQAMIGHRDKSARQAIIRTANQLKDGRVFASRIPLQHAVAVLYRSWFHDDTIPACYTFPACQVSSTSSESESESEVEEEYQSQPAESSHKPSCNTTLHCSPGAKATNNQLAMYTCPSPSSQTTSTSDSSRLNIKLDKVYLTRT